MSAWVTAASTSSVKASAPPPGRSPAIHATATSWGPTGERLMPGRNGASMKIADIFFSIQGEGRLLGVPSAFVRTTGCPLRCVWCDSEYTSWRPEGESLTAEEILHRLSASPIRHVVVTGGEPLIAPGIGELCAALRQRGYHITIETAGVVFKEVA